jgi:hypothetical protein
MTLPSPLSAFGIPAKVGIHLSACKLLSHSHERRGFLPSPSRAVPWIPAFAGMAVLFGRGWVGA